jgi:hypothetical protein
VGGDDVIAKQQKRLAVECQNPVGPRHHGAGTSRHQARCVGPCVSAMPCTCRRACLINLTAIAVWCVPSNSYSSSSSPGPGLTHPYNTPPSVTRHTRHSPGRKGAVTRYPRQVSEEGARAASRCCSAIRSGEGPPGAAAAAARDCSRHPTAPLSPSGSSGSTRVAGRELELVQGGDPSRASNTPPAPHSTSSRGRRQQSLLQQKRQQPTAVRVSKLQQVPGSPFCAPPEQPPPPPCLPSLLRGCRPQSNPPLVPFPSLRGRPSHRWPPPRAAPAPAPSPGIAPGAASGDHPALDLGREAPGRQTRT